MTMNDRVPMLPAPTPWMIRNTTSSSMLLASPLSSEPDQKQRHGHHEHAAPSVQVGEFAGHSHRRRRRQEVRGEDPAQNGSAVQVGDDVRQRRRHDGLIERRQHRHQADSRERGDELRPAPQGLRSPPPRRAAAAAGASSIETPSCISSLYNPAARHRLGGRYS